MHLHAKPVFFALLFCLVQVRAATIEGRVVNSVTNEPVPNAGLTLKCLEFSKQWRSCKDLTTKSAADGTFSFDRNVIPGTYLLTASGVTGLVSTRLSQSQFTLDRYSQQVTPLLKLEPEATITGKLLDGENHPRANTEVIALKQTASGPIFHLVPATRAMTDKAGIYLLHGLTPGNYYIATPISKRNDLVPQNEKQPFDVFLLYAPSAISLEDASPTHVESGHAYSAVDLHLRPLTTFRIEGKVQMELPDRIVSGQLELHLYPRDNSGITAPSRELALTPDGGFQVNVLPGLYTLRLIGVTTQTQAANIKTPPPLMVHLLAKQDIEIEGKGLYGLLLLIPPPFLLSGHIYTEDASGNNQPGKSSAALRPIDPFGASACSPAQPLPDGGFTITNCDASLYAVDYKAPSGSYVKAITFNNQDVLTHPIDLSQGAGGDLKILIHAGAAAAKITLANSTITEPGPPTEVVLIPDAWTPFGFAHLVRAKQKDNGFTASDLTPGHYTAVAASGVEPALWGNPVFVNELQSRGTPLDLAEFDQRQVTVAPLTASEITQLQIHLGLY